MENQYPDEAKREEIANACNSVIQKPGELFGGGLRITATPAFPPAVVEGKKDEPEVPLWGGGVVPF